MPREKLCEAAVLSPYQSSTTLQNRNLLLPPAPAVAVNDGVSRRLRDVTPSQGSQLLRRTYLRGTPSTLAWSSKESLQAQQQAPQSDIIIQMYVVDVKISSVALLHRASLILLKGCAQTSYYFCTTITRLYAHEGPDGVWGLYSNDKRRLTTFLMYQA